MTIKPMLLCSLILLCAAPAFADAQVPADGRDLTVIEENLPVGEGAVVANKEETLFKDSVWHKDKWQNSPAIIEITGEHLNLLFNRPEIVFSLRRGIRFEWQDTHEYSDGKVKTTYRFKHTGESRAIIEYESVLVEDPKQTASGSFEIESRP